MIKPTKGDFDRAIAQPWSPRTCLIAQLMIRCGRTPCLEGTMNDPLMVAIDNELRDLMTVFDRNFSGSLEYRPITESERRNLDQLRELLPSFNWPWQRLK